MSVIKKITGLIIKILERSLSRILLIYFIIIEAYFSKKLKKKISCGKMNIITYFTHNVLIIFLEFYNFIQYIILYNLNVKNKNNNEIS
jgi:hypothetical protein